MYAHHVYHYTGSHTTFEESSTHRCWAHMLEKSIWKKEKWKIKGNVKQCVALSLIHSTTHHYQALYQILKSWVNAFQRYLWRICFLCITYEREMVITNNIPTIYILCRGIMMLQLQMLLQLYYNLTSSLTPGQRPWGPMAWIQCHHYRVPVV